MNAQPCRADGRRLGRGRFHFIPKYILHFQYAVLYFGDCDIWCLHISVHVR